jgi:hypothetical protein
MEMRERQNRETTKITFAKTSPPERLLAFWKEIDDKTFGQAFDCFAPPYGLAEAQHLGEMLAARRLETARRVATRLGINEAPGK